MPNRFAARIAGLAVLVTTLAACTSGGPGGPATTDAPAGHAPSSTTAPPPVTTSSAAPRSSTPKTPASGSASRTKPATGDAVLVQRVDRVCAAGNRYRKVHPFPVAKFDPSDPAVSALPKVASYLKSEPDVAARLLRLDLPFGLATALTQERKNVNARIAAAQNSDPQTYSHVAKDGEVVAHSLRSALGPAGLSAAKACSTYFRS